MEWKVHCTSYRRRRLFLKSLKTCLLLFLKRTRTPRWWTCLCGLDCCWVVFSSAFSCYCSNLSWCMRLLKTRVYRVCPVYGTSISFISSRYIYILFMKIICLTTSNRRIVTLLTSLHTYLHSYTHMYVYTYVRCCWYSISSSRSTCGTNVGSQWQWQWHVHLDKSTTSSTTTKRSEKLHRSTLYPLVFLSICSVLVFSLIVSLVFPHEKVKLCWVPNGIVAYLTDFRRLFGAFPWWTPCCRTDTIDRARCGVRPCPGVARGRTATSCCVPFRTPWIPYFQQLLTIHADMTFPSSRYLEIARMKTY